MGDKYYPELYVACARYVGRLHRRLNCMVLTKIEIVDLEKLSIITYFPLHLA